jgi:diguanylate cyclase (GGDEF)-like protein
VTPRLASALGGLAQHARSLAERIGRGQLPLERFRAGAGELGQLARAFNCMVEGLEAEMERRREAEAKRQWDAVHDPLTGLPNRQLLLDRLQRSFARTRRDGRGVCALLVVDLEHMARLTASYGLALADELLPQVVRRIRTLLRRNDSLSRLDGHRLAVLMDDARSLRDPILLAQRLLHALGEPFTVGGQALACTAALGVAVDDGRIATAEEMLQAADIAVAQARASGGSTYELCDPDLRQRAMGVIELHQDLARAVRKGEIGVRFQPVVELASGEVTGLEALATWERLPRVSPLEFILLAEQTGLINPLGRLVLRQACAELASCPAWRHGALAHAALCFNVSGRQLSRPELVGEILEELNEHGIPPRRLVVEITESALVNETDEAKKVVGALIDRGVRFAIDDFGTGYASMSYLQSFPAQEIKIDRSFVTAMTRERSSLEIVRAGISLAHRLGKSVTAEGVETAEQLAELEAMGCDRAQGFLFGAPLRCLDAERLAGLPRRRPAAVG